MPIINGHSFLQTDCKCGINGPNLQYLICLYGAILRQIG